MWQPERRPAIPIPAASSPAPWLAAASQAASSQVVASQAGQQQRRLAPSDAFLYRAMTANLEEFEPRPIPDDTGVGLACLILDAVEMGSTVRSPFFHFSVDFFEARKWRVRTWFKGSRSATLARMAYSLPSDARTNSRSGHQSGSNCRFSFSQRSHCQDSSSPYGMCLSSSSTPPGSKCS